MKKHYFFFTISLFLFILVKGNCQNVKITNQAQLNNYAGSTFISGQLVIGPDNCCSSDITDLSPLIDLQGINGDLKIQNNPHLKNLHGLEHLQLITGNEYVTVKNCDSLVNLEGLTYFMFGTNQFTESIVFQLEGNEMLKNLIGIPFMWRPILNILDCPALINLEGMDEMKEVQINIHNCPNLENLHGLEKTEKVFSQFIVFDCPKLKNFKELHNLKEAQYIQWVRLDSLENSDGLEKVVSATSIEIDTCPRMTALTGFDSLKGWMNEMIIQKCHQLGDFPMFSDSAGIEELTYIQCDSVKIINNFNHLRFHIAHIGINKSLKFVGSLPRGVTNPAGLLPELYFGSPNLTEIHDNGTIHQDDWNEVSISYSNKLTDIAGLSVIKKPKHLAIYNNHSLQSLQGLTNLDGLIFLNLYKNHNLSDISAISYLDSLGSLSTGGNNFTSLKSLSKLKYIQYSCDVSGDSTITNFDEFEDSIKYCGLELNIIGVLKLEKISGFNNLSSMGWADGDLTGRINIYENPNLKSISGFQGLDSLKFYNPNNSSIYIRSNDSLKYITGFSNLNYAGSDFDLYNNPNLKNATGFCKLLKTGTIKGTIEILNNAFGANTKQQIKNSCDSIIMVENEPQKILKMTVFPNPTMGNITVQLPENHGFDQLFVYDLVGKLVFSIDLSDNETESTLNLSGIQEGIYFLKPAGSKFISNPVKIFIFRE
jgi:Secretion system C-terminal sorting domain